MNIRNLIITALTSVALVAILAIPVGHSSEFTTVPNDTMLPKLWDDWSTYHDSKEQFVLSQSIIKNHISSNKIEPWNQISRSSIAMMHNFEVIIGKPVDYNELALLFAYGQQPTSNEAVQKYYAWLSSKYATPTSVQDASNRINAMIGGSQYRAMAEDTNGSVLALVTIGAVPKEIVDTDPQYWIELAGESACDPDSSCRTTLNTQTKFVTANTTPTANKAGFTYAYISINTSCNLWGEADCIGVGYNKVDASSFASATADGGSAHAKSKWLSYYIYGYSTGSSGISATVSGAVGHHGTETDEHNGNKPETVFTLGALYASGAKSGGDNEYGTYHATVNVYG